jgi:hypothetical protein
VNIRLLIALAAILFSASSNADWDSRFFPTTNAPLRSGGDFAFDVVASQMVWAVNERYWAVKKTNGWLFAEEPIERGPRFYEEVMLDVKAGLRSIIGDFLDISAMTNGPNELIYHTPVGLLSRLALPEDYFDVVPVRNPMGHDWPTNNPSGQKGKDYGWHGLYMILTNLTHTYENAGFLNAQTVDIYSFTGGGPLDCSFSSVSNWPNTIQSYVQSFGARDFYGFGGYNGELIGVFEFYYYEESRSSGSFGSKAAWLYNKNLAGEKLAYLDAVADSWLLAFQGWNFSFEPGFSGPDIAGATNACPTLFIEPTNWVYTGVSGALRLLDDGNVLKTGAADSLAVTCSAQSLVGFAGTFGCDADGRVGSLCYEGDVEEWRGCAEKDSEVVVEGRYSHILNWNFRYK